MAKNGPAVAAARRRLAYHLRRAMRASVGRPMVWGRDDCVLFQADVHKAALGVDPVPQIRGRYASKRGAARVIGKPGLGAALARIARRMEWSKIDPCAARIGDIGLIVLPSGPSIVRCLHRGEWIGRNQAGWSMVTTRFVKRCWSVT